MNNALHYGLPILALDSVRSAEGYLVNDKVNGRISTLDSFKDDLLKMIDSDLSSMSDNSFKLNEQWKLGVAKHRFIKIIHLYLFCIIILYSSIVEHRRYY